MDLNYLGVLWTLAEESFLLLSTAFINRILVKITFVASFPKKDPSRLNSGKFSANPSGGGRRRAELSGQYDEGEEGEKCSLGRIRTDD